MRFFRGMSRRNAFFRDIYRFFSRCGRIYRMTSHIARTCVTVTSLTYPLNQIPTFLNSFVWIDRPWQWEIETRFLYLLIQCLPDAGRPECSIDRENETRMGVKNNLFTFCHSSWIWHRTASPLKSILFPLTMQRCSRSDFKCHISLRPKYWSRNVSSTQSNTKCDGST